MDVSFVALLVVIAVALVFDFTNGFHDAANSIATIVSTRVLSPRQAVAWAAFFNFVAFLVLGTSVANTIAKGVVVQEALTVGVIFAGLLGAIVWNLTTFWYGLPTSSSHALVGGMCGAAVAASGFDILIEPGIRKIVVFIILSPLLGLALAFVLHVLVLHVFARSKRVHMVNRGFRVGQLFSSAAFSLGHGGNDAQKTMGVVLALLIASDHLPASADVPLWVILAAHGAIALGTLIGGWRIVHTLGTKITKLEPSGGMVAESTAAAALFYATSAGIPVSTTHTITGAVIGVGATKRPTAVRWRVATRVITAWFLTLPGAFCIGGTCSIVVGWLG